MDTLVYGLLTKEIKETIGASYVSSISSSDINNVYLDVTYKKDDSSTDTVRLTFPKPLNGANGINGVDGEDGLSIVSASFVGNDMVFTRSDSSTIVIVGAKTLLTPNIESKQDLLVSGTNIKTVLGQTIVGSGNLDINADQIDTSSTTNKFITQARITKLDGIEAGAQVNTVSKVNEKTGDVVLTQNDVDDTASYIRMTPAERAKLGNLTDNFKGLYANSTARDLAIPSPQNGNYVIQDDTASFWYYSTSWNDTGTISTGDMNKAIYDPQNINGDTFSRANHMGTQLSSTISDFNTAVASSPSVTANTSKVSFPEAPNDGSYYARKSQGWSPVLYTENTIFLENPTVPNVASGDSSTKVANTAFVNSMLDGNTVPAKSLSANGYVKMANGLIIQWGSQSVDGNRGPTFSFPIAFPTTCAGFSTNNYSSNYNQFSLLGGRPVSSSQFVLQNAENSAVTVYWMAIGY